MKEDREEEREDKKRSFSLRPPPAVGASCICLVWVSLHGVCVWVCVCVCVFGGGGVRACVVFSGFDSLYFVLQFYLINPRSSYFQFNYLRALRSLISSDISFYTFSA